MSSLSLLLANANQPARQMMKIMRNYYDQVRDMFDMML